MRTGGKKDKKEAVEKRIEYKGVYISSKEYKLKKKGEKGVRSRQREKGEKARIQELQ